MIPSFHLPKKLMHLTALALAISFGNSSFADGGVRVIIMAAPGGDAFNGTNVTAVENGFDHLAQNVPNYSRTTVGNGVRTLTLDEIGTPIATAADAGDRILLYIMAHGELDGATHTLKINADADAPHQNTGDFFTYIDQVIENRTIDIFMTSCHGAAALSVGQSNLATGSSVAVLSASDECTAGADVDRLATAMGGFTTNNPDDLSARFLLDLYLTRALRNRMSPSILLPTGTIRTLRDDMLGLIRHTFSTEEHTAAHARLDRFMGEAEVNRIIGLYRTGPTEFVFPALDYGKALAAALTNRPGAPPPPRLPRFRFEDRGPGFSYGESPQLELDGEPGMECWIEGTDGFYWSGEIEWSPTYDIPTEIVANPLFVTSATYSGGCSWNGDAYPLNPLSANLTSFPSPALQTSASSIGYGQTPTLQILQGTANLSCSIQGTDGFYWSGILPNTGSTTLLAAPVYSSFVEYSGQCTDPAGNIFALTAQSVVMTGYPTPYLISPTSTSYGASISIQIAGLAPGVYCSIWSGNGDYWYGTEMNPGSGISNFTTNPIYTDVSFYGDCYDVMGNYFPIVAVNTSPAGLPTPQLVAPSVVNYGTSPTLQITGLTASISCSLSSTNGDYWYGTETAPGLGVSFVPANPILTDVTFSGDCSDSFGNSFPLGNITSRVTSLPTPYLAGPVTLGYGEMPSMEVRGIIGGLTCSICSTAGDYWYGSEDVIGTGLASFIGSPLNAEQTTYSGDCYDPIGNYFPLSPISITATSFPSPTVTASSTALLSDAIQ